MFFGLVGAAAVDALAAGTGARSRGGPIGESRRGLRRSFYHRRPRATARSPALVIAVGAERGRFMKTANFAPFETSPARTSATRVQVWMTARWVKNWRPIDSLAHCTAAYVRARNSTGHRAPRRSCSPPPRQGTSVVGAVACARPIPAPPVCSARKRGCFFTLFPRLSDPTRAVHALTPRPPRPIHPRAVRPYRDEHSRRRGVLLPLRRGAGPRRSHPRRLRRLPREHQSQQTQPRRRRVPHRRSQALRPRRRQAGREAHDRG